MFWFEYNFYPFRVIKILKIYLFVFNDKNWLLDFYDFVFYDEL